MVLSVCRTEVPRESCCATVARQNLGEETVLMIQLTLATLFFKTFSQNILSKPSVRGMARGSPSCPTPLRGAPPPLT